MSWQLKSMIGAAGGLALVLLKLIEVQFFVDDFGSSKAFAAYLTYAAYVLLGVLVALFFTDESLDEPKRRRSAFFSGLLAPSILLAVVHQPVGGQGEQFRQGLVIPKIGSLFISEAYAQTPTPIPDVAAQIPVPVVNLKKADVETSFVAGLKAAVGRAEPSKNLIYVLGETSTKAKAVEVATDVNKLLASQAKPADTAAHVYRPEGANTWFVTVGKFNAANVVLSDRDAAKSAAIKTLTGNAAMQSEKNVAKLMLEGKIVDGSAFFEKH